MTEISENRIDYLIQQFEDLNNELDLLMSLGSEIQFYSRNIDKFTIEE